MGRLILDEAMKARLAALCGSVELCDGDGQVLGYYFDTEEYRRLLMDMALAQVTDEELEETRREYREIGGVTTAELLAHLRSLGVNGSEGV